jgi:hypothetical protein
MLNRPERVKVYVIVIPMKGIINCICIFSEQANK